MNVRILGWTPHSKHRSLVHSLKEGCRKPVLGVWVDSSLQTALPERGEAHEVDLVAVADTKGSGLY